MTKPSSLRELALRAQAVLRTGPRPSTAATPQPIRSGRLESDVVAWRARSDGRERFRAALRDPT